MKENRRAAVTCGLMTLMLFAALAVYMRARLEYAGTWGQTLSLAALFALVAGGAMALVARLQKPERGALLLSCTVIALTMLARVSMLDYQTADYNAFLSGWVKVFREGGFYTLGENVGDYNLLYQYVMLMIAKTPLHDLYLIKFFTVIFDYALALAMMQAAGHFAGKKAALPVMLIVCALPTTLIDGACWGQCDTVYVFLIVMSLYWMKTKKPVGAAVMLSLAFAFKLQTIFFFPVVLLALIHGEYKPRHALVFAATYLVTMLPALIAGRSFADAVSVYANQSMGQYYERLFYNAPNLYTFFPLRESANRQEFTWMRYLSGIDGEATNAYIDQALTPTYQNAALYACTGPAAIRYPRGGEGSYTAAAAGTLLREGYSCTVICYGTMINAVLAAADTLQAAGYRPEILKLRTISPVDWAGIEASARKTRRVFVLEETSDRECLADEIFAHLIEAGIPAVCRKRNLGRRFVPHGAPAALLAAAGLDADSITTMMQEELSR